MSDFNPTQWLKKWPRAIARLPRQSDLIPVSWVLALSVAFSAASQTTEQVSVNRSLNSSNAQVIFNPPTSDSEKDSRGGASRPAQSKCRDDRFSEVPLTALIPDRHAGLTIASYPTFFVYVPPTSAQQLYFNLKDANNQGIYQTMLPISGQPGVVNIQWPKNQPPLEIGQTYYWSAVLMCPSPQTDMPSVTVSVQRVEIEATMTEEIEESPTLEQAAFYAELGIWYDTLTTLFQLNQFSHLNDYPASEENLIHQNWVNLLNSVGLEAIADRPLLEQP